MNEKIENNIEQILNYLQEGVQTAGSFVAEQTPLLIQEILSYHLLYHGTWLSIGVLLLLSVIFCFVYFARKIDWSDGIESIYLLGVIGFVASIGIILGNVFTFIKIIVAPRLYLLEYVSDLIK